mgnify:CR=1 FL=1
MAGDDDVVLVMAGMFVEIPATGDESDLRVRRISVYLVFGEGVFAIVGDVIDAECGLLVGFAGDGESVFGLETA